MILSVFVAGVQGDAERNREHGERRIRTYDTKYSSRMVSDGIMIKVKV